MKCLKLETGRKKFSNGPVPLDNPEISLTNVPVLKFNALHTYFWLYLNPLDICWWLHEHSELLFHIQRRKHKYLKRCRLSKSYNLEQCVLYVILVSTGFEALKTCLFCFTGKLQIQHIYLIINEQWQLLQDDWMNTLCFFSLLLTLSTCRWLDLQEEAETRKEWKTMNIMYNIKRHIGYALIDLAPPPITPLCLSSTICI